MWGSGSRFPDAPFAHGAGNGVAEGIARGAGTYEGDGWLAIVESDEQTVDAWSMETGASYAPYPIEGKDEDVAARPMEGTLRSDVAPPRKVDQPRPT